MDKKDVTEQDLAQAFTAEEAVEDASLETAKKLKNTKKSRKSPALLISIIMMVVGLIMLIVGVVLLVLDLTRGPEVSDGEYLMSAERWVLSDGTNCANGSASDMDETDQAANAEATNCLPSVYWKFTEVGNGTLTTNNHINDYDFIWAIEGGKLKIETKWLYDLENEFDYEINRSEGALILRDGDKETVFIGDFAKTE